MSDHRFGKTDKAIFMLRNKTVGFSKVFEKKKQR